MKEVTKLTKNVTFSQFNTETFRIEDIHKAPRAYLETALEHFYNESMKSKQKQHTMSIQDKLGLFNAHVKHVENNKK